MKIFKDVGTIAIADIIASGIGSVFWLYLASLLTSDKYGEIQFFMSIAGMGFVFALLGTRNTITVYEAKKIEIRKILFTLSIFGGVIISLILFFYYQRLDIILLIFGFIFSELSIGYILGKKFFRQYAKFMILQKSLMFILAISFYNLLDEETIIFGIAFSYFPFIWIIAKSFTKSKMNFPIFKQHFGFIVNNYSLILLGAAKGHMDKIIIAPLIGFAALGNYSLAFQVYLVLMIFTNMIFKYSLPHDSDGTISKKIKIVTIIASSIFALISTILGPILIPIIFPNFVGAIEAIPYLSLAVIPNTIALLFSSKYLGKEKSRYVVGGVGSSTAIYILLIFILAPEYQIVGIAISYLISSIGNALFYVVIFKLQK